MPAKRPPKRSQDDDASSSGHAKKPGKNKREVTYGTYDEALDGAYRDYQDPAEIRRWCRDGGERGEV